MAKKTYKGKDKYGISRWLFDWKDYLTGERHRKTFTMSESDAEEKRSKLESLEMCRETGIPVDVKDPNSVTVQYVFDSFLNYYLNLCSQKKRSHKSLKRHEFSLKKFLEVFPGTTPVSNLIVAVVDGVVHNPMQKFNDHYNYHSPSGINNNLQGISSAFNWAKRNKIISAAPVAVREVVKKKKVHILTDEDIRAIMHTEIDQDTKNLFILYLNTGARKIEILKDNLTWDDIDWQKKEINLLRKNDERHTIVVNDMVLSILAGYKHRSHPIPYGASYVDKRIIELRELSGIHFTCHDIRRAAGALLVRSGVRLAKVSKWMNHKDIKITYDHYYDIIDTERENIANKLEEKCLDMMIPSSMSHDMVAN